MSNVLVPVAKRVVPRSWRDALRDRQLEHRLVRRFFASLAELRQYEQELTGLRETIMAAREEFLAELGGRITARGHAASFGNLAWGPSGRLYALIRKLQPETLVETGVCNGVSTSVILSALQRNGAGRLWSIDYPEYSDGSTDDFSDTKLGAVVPSGRQPGWVIPDDLRERWELIIGKSQEELPPLLDRLGTIDFFMHDSEHSYECMTFEMESAAGHLAPGGLLVVDDSGWNDAFEHFVTRRGLPRYILGGGAESTVLA
jgi:Methyltransferase domain